MSAAYAQVYFRLDFFMEASNMNPDQTASKGVSRGKENLIFKKIFLS